MDHFSGIDEAHPLLRMTAVVLERVKEVEDVDPVFMTPGDQAEFLRQVDALTDRLGLLKLGVVREAGALAAEAGCRSVADWRVAEHRCDASNARREDRLAEALGERWTATADAVRAGAMSLEKAEVAARGLDDLAAALEEEWAETLGGLDADAASALDTERTRSWIAEVLDRAEAHLVEVAAGLTPTQLRRVAEHLLGTVAPEHAEELERRALERAERRAREKARLSLRKLGDGTTRLSARLPDAAAHALKGYLHAFTSPRVTRPTGTDMNAPGTDGASGSATVFGDPGPQPGQPGQPGQPDQSDGEPGEPGRTLVDPWVDPATGRRIPQQYRMGQAFVALLERITSLHLPQHGGLGASVVVTIDLEDLREGVGHGTIGDPDGEGVDVSVGQVRRLACAAGILPAVLGSESVVLDLGRTSRLFSAGQRKAHAITHQTCQADGCTVPAAWCESHHRRDPWAKGGTTDRDDLAFLCPWHHHRAHDPTYRVDWTATGATFHRRR